MEKVVTSIGLYPVENYVKNKIYVWKEIYIVVTWYEVLDNDIKKGVNSFLLVLVRVGKFIQANEDTYKRVYEEYGTYHYPPIL